MIKLVDIPSLLTRTNIYRSGPALLAFSLAMCAYSLRTWRRNGVACDELLFLPGSVHGQRHGLDGTATNANATETPRENVGEGDAAAGWNANTATSSLDMELTARTSTPDASPGPRRNRALSQESSISSIQEFANSWDDGDDENDFFINDQPQQQQQQLPQQPGPVPRNERPHQHSRVERFQENHPRITRFGSFFFFRSSSTSTQSAEYAPSGPSVVGAAMDLSMPILFNFHLFIEAYNHHSDDSSIPPQVLPMIFLSVLIFRSFFPPGRRLRFWGTMRFTVGAPWHPTSFRDCFVGDVLTSLVRPCQDVLFALSYYFTVVWGTISGRYGLSESGDYLESSWILHNVVLPSAAILPLWWKFLQTLRQAHDTQQRWPHLGNALKYLTACVVILYGMTHPEDRRSPWWLVSFGLATIYQIAWDTLVDWELFVIEPRQSQATDFDDAWFTRIYSYSPNSQFLSLLDNCVRPLRKTVLSRIPSYRQIKLRSQRLYKSETFYYKIFAFNAVFRFTWMLCFIPAYHLSRTGVEHITTFSSDTNSYVGVLLPVFEILRRTFWGFLYLENKTIRMHQEGGGNPYSRVDRRDEDDVDQDNMEHGSDMSDSSSKVHLPSWLLGSPLHQQEIKCWDRIKGLFECNEDMRHRLFIAELSVWAFAFVGFGLWATG